MIRTLLGMRSFHSQVHAYELHRLSDLLPTQRQMLSGAFVLRQPIPLPHFSASETLSRSPCGKKVGKANEGPKKKKSSKLQIAGIRSSSTRTNFDVDVGFQMILCLILICDFFSLRRKSPWSQFLFNMSLKKKPRTAMRL